MTANDVTFCGFVIQTGKLGRVLIKSENTNLGFLTPFFKITVLL